MNWSNVTKMLVCLATKVTLVQSSANDTLVETEVTVTNEIGQVIMPCSAIDQSFLVDIDLTFPRMMLRIVVKHVIA